MSSAASSDHEQFSAYPLTARGLSVRVSAPRAFNLSTAWSSVYRRRLIITDLLVTLAVVVVSVIAESTVHGVAPDRAVYAGAVLLETGWLSGLAIQHTRDRRVVGTGSVEYRRVMTTTVFVFAFAAAIAVAFSLPDWRAYMVVGLPLGVVALFAERWLWRRWLVRQRSAGRLVSTAIVVGSPADVDYVVRQLGRKATAPYRVVAAVIDGGEAGPAVRDDSSISVWSGLDSVLRAAELHGADAVIVANQPNDGGGFVRELSWNLESTSAELVLANCLTNVAGPRIQYRPVEGLPLMHVEQPQFDGLRHVLKRVMDVAISGMALALLLPLFALLAIAIKADDRGPVFFRQERVGRGGTTFRMVKFRSMVVDAERQLEALRTQNEGSGVLFKMKRDPRITRVGAVLRKYSLDELPQLWNIFVGDMSLVGPRPPLVREVDAYEDHVHRRLYIKPGLTGMWQVSGRSDLSWEESVRLDLFYVENWSIAGDLMIMWRTLGVLLKPVGAY